MIIFKLTRTLCNEQYTKGVLKIVGTNFSCLTVERKHLSTGTPLNPRLEYALQSGIYPVRMKYSGIYPFTPFIIAPHYHNICFKPFSHDAFTAGSIAIGTNVNKYGALMGFDEAMEAIQILYKKNYNLWQNIEIEIREGNGFYFDGEDSIEEVEPNFNFAGL